LYFLLFLLLLGNKIRKLEFLLADAVQLGCDSVVTIGGEQSNHCRATAAAARMVGMEPHLILRTNRVFEEGTTRDCLGMTGNLLFDRMVASTIYTCTPGEYGRLGSVALVNCLCRHLKAAAANTNLPSRSTGLRPYPIPVGGSNGLGSFGYLRAVDELISQWKDQYNDDDNQQEQTIDHIVFACGSGGTAAGIVLGIAIAYGALNNNGTVVGDRILPKVHAVGVCDSPDYFYKCVADIANDMGLILPKNGTCSTEDFVRQHMIVHQGKGLGYAISTDEELDFVSQFAMETGIALDPVYSGKALYRFVTDVVLNDASPLEGKNILLWHTGGALGLYDKGEELLRRLEQQSPVKRLDVYGKCLHDGVGISESAFEKLSGE
jgi:D-cysteine desulfhydrase